MIQWTPQTDVEVDVVTSLAARPAIYRRLSLAGILRSGEAEHLSEIEYLNGESEAYVLGEPTSLLEIGVEALTADDYLHIKRIVREKAQCYILPHFPATALLNAPLVNGAGGDPVDGVYSGGAANTATRLFIPRADAGTGVFFEEHDPDDPVIIEGIRTGEGTETPFALPTGVLLLPGLKNLVQNSLLGDLDANYIPANWEQTGGTGGTDCGVIDEEDSWCGLPAFYIWGTSVTITSDKFAVTAGKKITLSAAWKTDGGVKIGIEFPGSGIAFPTKYGVGYWTEVFTVPTGATTAYVSISLDSGSYAEVAGISVYGATFDWQNSTFFVGASGSGLCGEIEEQSIEYTLPMQPGVFADGPCLALIGYIQPAWLGLNSGPTQTLAKFINSVTGHDNEFDIADWGTGLKLHIRQNGVLKGSSSAFLHNPGQVYAFACWFGYTVDLTTFKMGMRLRQVGASVDIATLEVSTSIDPSTVMDKLVLGNNNLDLTAVNSILGGVVVCTVKYDDLGTVMTGLADEDRLDFYRPMVGALYELSHTLSQDPYNRQLYSGTISAKQRARI